MCWRSATAWRRIASSCTSGVCAFIASSHATRLTLLSTTTRRSPGRRITMSGRRRRPSSSVLEVWRSKCAPSSRPELRSTLSSISSPQSPRTFALPLSARVSAEACVAMSWLSVLSSCTAPSSEARSFASSPYTVSMRWRKEPSWSAKGLSSSSMSAFDWPVAVRTFCSNCWPRSWKALPASSVNFAESCSCALRTKASVSARARWAWSASARARSMAAASSRARSRRRATSARSSSRSPARACSSPSRVAARTCASARAASWPVSCFGRSNHAQTASPSASAITQATMSVMVMPVVLPRAWAVYALRASQCPRPRAMARGVPSIEHAAEHRLQVTRLLHLRQERMVGTGAGDLEHLHRAPGVERGAAQHVEELFLAHQARAGERGEQAARLHHAQRQLVHVQVFLERGDHLLAVARHLGRVEDHDVELLAVVPRIAQPREDVRLHEARAHVVEFGVALGDLDDIVVDVDAHHFAGAARGRVDREAAGVAAQVEHALAGAQVREPLAVLALVGEEPRLVRARRIGAEADA